VGEFECFECFWREAPPTVRWRNYLTICSRDGVLMRVVSTYSLYSNTILVRDRNRLTIDSTYSRYSYGFLEKGKIGVTVRVCVGSRLTIVSTYSRCCIEGGVSDANPMTIDTTCSRVTIDSTCSRLFYLDLVHSCDEVGKWNLVLETFHDCDQSRVTIDSTCSRVF
jgi:hypothetical protein